MGKGQKKGTQAIDQLREIATRAPDGSCMAPKDMDPDDLIDTQAQHIEIVDIALALFLDAVDSDDTSVSLWAHRHFAFIADAREHLNLIRALSRELYSRAKAHGGVK